MNLCLDLVPTEFNAAEFRMYALAKALSQYFQILLGNFMQCGHYAEYLRQMQQLYLKRYQTFMNCFEFYLSEFCFVKQHHPSMQVACYFKAEFPNTLEQALVNGAELHNIAITRLSQFYEYDREYGFVLGFSSLNDTEIKLCMKELRQLIHNELACLI